MKRQIRTQQEGTLKSKELATISLTCNTSRDRISKGTCKTCQYPQSLTFYPLSTPIIVRSLASGLGSYSVELLDPIEQLPEAHVVLGSYPLAQLDRLPEELLEHTSTVALIVRNLWKVTDLLPSFPFISAASTENESPISPFRNSGCSFTSSSF